MTVCACACGRCWERSSQAAGVEQPDRQIRLPNDRFQTVFNRARGFKPVSVIWRRQRYIFYIKRGFKTVSRGASKPFMIASRLWYIFYIKGASKPFLKGASNPFNDGIPKSRLCSAPQPILVLSTMYVVGPYHHAWRMIQIFLKSCSSSSSRNIIFQFSIVEIGCGF